MGNSRKPNAMVGRNGKKKFYSGEYKVINIKKYIGDPTKIYYRSGWELKFMIYLDSNDSILRWSSEQITIPYQDVKGHYHRYYPDFYIERIDNQNHHRFDRVVIEIKPNKEKFPPKQPKKMTAKALESYEYQLRNYQKNIYKWSKAKIYCEKMGMVFYIMDEFDLKKYGIMNIGI